MICTLKINVFIKLLDPVHKTGVNDFFHESVNWVGKNGSLDINCRQCFMLLLLRCIYIWHFVFCKVQSNISQWESKTKDDLEDLTKHWASCLNGREPLFPLIQGEGLKVMKITSLSTPYRWNVSSMCSRSWVRWTNATLLLCVQAGVA